MSNDNGQLMAAVKNAKAPDTDLDELLNQHFAGRVVRKDLT